MRRLAYAGSGMIVDAETKNIISPKRIVFEYNLMAESIDKSDPKPFSSSGFADTGATPEERN